MSNPIAVAIVHAPGLFDLNPGAGLADLPIGTHVLYRPAGLSMEQIEAIVDANYPEPTSPHGSVIQRAGEARLACRAGIKATIAALAGSATPSKPSAPVSIFYRDEQFDTLSDRWARTIINKERGGAKHKDVSKAFDEMCSYLDARFGAVEKDAIRYRYLRDGANFPAMVWEALEGHGSDTAEGYGRSMDEAIDAARVAIGQEAL